MSSSISLSDCKSNTLQSNLKGTLIQDVNSCDACPVPKETFLLELEIYAFEIC